MRTTKDSMGDMQVPDEALWGASTQRAVLNFPISGRPMPAAFIRGLGLVKFAAARANEELGRLPPGKSRLIQQAAREIAEGRHAAHFPVDVFQTGSGTSTNTNAHGARVFTEKCVVGIEADAARCRELMERSLMLVTALNPHLGYDVAASVAKEALASGQSLSEVVRARGLMDAATLARTLEPLAMVRPGDPAPAAMTPPEKVWENEGGHLKGPAALSPPKAALGGAPPASS